ncbi:TPA: CBS domain-containing protein [Candidatus Poribacteria bacterium]|jgi:CBS domain-containing protein|nr:CBS domain-containing protein [Candidatus Poribacteria bacterium]HIA65499.1 CBS domain-containing protein [Candidatus Poribacteria bacterium]HIB89286.1 CBS domain-containing protein [Candidatus Poribacteria bacterium]HIC02921.1 CBS domain-containing protein [Candidatus Poribacteria bacterium]HIN29565.1 CBS domain-containing protein [Candidatus Poribacteria bacterium]
MPYEDMIEDELMMMDEQLAEPSKSLHEIQVPLSSLMEEVTIIDSGSSIQEAADLMIKNNIGYVIVTRDNKLRGIFGERDILLNFLNTDLGSWDDLIVDDHMKENPKTLQSDDLLDTAIFFMANGGYRHIPIVDDRYQPIGMVSVLDIMTYLVEHFPQEILTLPPRPIRDAMKAREGA